MVVSNKTIRPYYELSLAFLTNSVFIEAVAEVGKDCGRLWKIGRAQEQAAPLTKYLVPSVSKCLRLIR